MRRDDLISLVLVGLFLWCGVTFYLFSHQPLQRAQKEEYHEYNRLLENKYELANKKIKDQMKANNLLLDKLKVIKKNVEDNKDSFVDIDSFIELIENPEGDVERVVRLIDKQKPKEREADYNSEEYRDSVKEEKEDDEGDDDIDVEHKVMNSLNSKPVIPVLLFSCNRVTVSKALDLLINLRPSKDQFPIIVSQDCDHYETRVVIEGYGDQVVYIQQPDQSKPSLPAKEKKFLGYFKIARHYGWALNQVFMEMDFDQVIIVEDDLEISPDFYEYFTATLPLLRRDPSLWCVSAWNDNGKAGLINQTAPELLYRTDFFPGLGWMMTKDLWREELMNKWAKSYWDDWMRLPEQRKGRSCIRPEISRTKTFGKIGVSNGLFYEKHLKYIVLNEKFVPFTVMDLSFLLKENYDKSYVGHVYSTPVVSVEDLKRGNVGSKREVRVTYFSSNDYKRAAKALGIMDDFKSGVPRLAYRGIVTFMRGNTRVFLAPNKNWAGYDPKWS